MSARIESGLMNWNALNMTGIETMGTHLSEMDVECLFQNFDAKNLVAPLREIRAKPGNGQAQKRITAEERRAAVALQQKWDSWLVQRDLLRAQIKRGKECLQQVRKELVESRADLEDWPAFERVCGRNPLSDYMQTICAKERIAKFLPRWIKRQRAQLQALTRKIGICARENELEHLL